MNLVSEEEVMVKQLLETSQLGLDHKSDFFKNS